MTSLVYRSIYSLLGVSLLQGLATAAVPLSPISSVSPLCHRWGGNGNLQDLITICGDKPVPNSVGQRIEVSSKYQVTQASEAVVVDRCRTTGDERSRYIIGTVSNRTGGTVTNVVVRYQVIEQRDGDSTRVARRSGLRIDEKKLEIQGEGRFEGTNNKFNVPNGETEVLSIEWRDRNGQKAGYKYPRPRYCRFGSNLRF